MRPGDPNAWELTAPEEEPARPSGFVPGMRYGTGGNDLTAPDDPRRRPEPMTRREFWAAYDYAVAEGKYIEASSLIREARCRHGTFGWACQERECFIPDPWKARLHPDSKLLVRSRYDDWYLPLHTHTMAGASRHLNRAWTVLWVKVARAVAGALAGGWRP